MLAAAAAAAGGWVGRHMGLELGQASSRVRLFECRTSAPQPCLSAWFNLSIIHIAAGAGLMPAPCPPLFSTPAGGAAIVGASLLWVEQPDTQGKLPT